MYIAAYLLKNGHDVKIVDLYASHLQDREIISFIRRFKPWMVGLSTFTASTDPMFYLGKLIKETFPSIKIVLGGIHASYLPGACLSHQSVDFVIRGEGEITFLELVNAIETNKSFSDVNGIAYRLNGKIVCTPHRQLISDVDSLPWPAYHLIDFDKYFLAITRGVTNKRVASILTMRGCLYKCTFCSHHYDYNSRVRKRDSQDVVDEIRYLYEKYGVRELQFEDNSFTCDPERVLKICSLINKNKLRISWNCNIRADKVSDELFYTMKKSGCESVLLGVESGSQKMLDLMKKGVTVEQVRSAVKIVKKYHIRINCSFVIGTPGDTRDTVLQTYRLAKELDPDYVMFSSLIPSVGSELFEVAVEEGKVDIHTLKGADYITVYSDKDPIIEMCQLTKEELIFFMEKFTRSFYLRPKYIIKRLLNIRSFSEIIRIFWGLSMIFKHQLRIVNKIIAHE